MQNLLLNLETEFYLFTGIDLEGISGLFLGLTIFCLFLFIFRFEKKREIFLLKPQYFKQFVDEFRKNNLYKKDANYISQRLKKTG